MRIKLNAISTLLFLVGVTALQAQTISQSVLPTAGAYFSAANGSLSWTLGETVTPTQVAGGIVLSQGFQQTYTLTGKVKALIQGYNIGAGAMQAVLYNQGQPNGLNDADSITVELHNPTAPFAMAHTFTGILKTNGTITCSFPNASEGQSYYITLKHRNTVETWSANPIVLNNTVYDFTTAANKAYGDNQVEMSGVWCLYSGDMNQDGVIDVFDYLELDPDIFSGNSGYLSTDLNGDGVVDAFDYLILDPNMNNGIGLITP